MHQSRGDRFGQAFHFDGLGAERHVFAFVFPQDDIADMDADARLQRQEFHLAQLTQQTLIVDGEGHGLDRPVEQQQEAVGFVDLAAFVALEQIAREAIELLREFGAFAITELFDQRGAVDQIAHDDGAQHRFRRRVPAG